MNRYRIILESETVLADDELNELILSLPFTTTLSEKLGDFFLVEAINLEGIKSGDEDELIG